MTIQPDGWPARSRQPLRTRWGLVTRSGDSIQKSRLHKNSRQVQSAILEPGKQFLADQFQALFETVILKSQIKHQVFDVSRPEFFDPAAQSSGLPTIRRPSRSSIV